MQTITLEQERILPAPSNSRLSVQILPIHPKTPIQQLPQEIEKVSIDKLVIAANLNPYLVQSLITNFCNEPNVVFQGDRSSSHFSATIMENVNCFFDEYGPNKRARTFRIEFNPNEAPAEWMPYYQAHILPCLTDVGFTRIDIAVDTNANLSGYYLDTIVPLKTNTWRGRNKALETIYFGGTDSTKRIRIYDKKKQLHDKKKIEIAEPVLWRIESQLRGDKVDTWKESFDNLVIGVLNLSTLKPLERATCIGLLQEPDIFKELDRKTARKYRKLIQDAREFDFMPALNKAMKQSESRLQSELEQWMPGKERRA